MTTLPSLYTLASEFRQQAEKLADLDLDPQTVADTLESLQWPIEEKSRAIAAFIGNMDAAANMVSEFARRKEHEASRMKARVAHLRTYLLANMQACGISEIKTLDGSMTIKLKQNPESVKIEDGAQLADEFLRVNITKEPNKTAIKDAIHSGRDIEGCSLVRVWKVEIK